MFCALKTFLILLVLSCSYLSYGQNLPTIVTDQADYMAGTTVTLTGSNFQAFELVSVQIVHVDGTDADDPAHAPFFVAADVDGTFIATWYVPTDGDEDGALLEATAIGQTSGATALVRFTDAVKVDFRQSANNDAGYGLGNVHWINSIVQQSNSTYNEGMSNMQRVVLSEVAPTTGNIHSLKFSHQFTKGGIHAYDFLTGRSSVGSSAATGTGWDQAIADNEAALATSYSINKCGGELGPPAGLAGMMSKSQMIISLVLIVQPCNAFKLMRPSTATDTFAFMVMHLSPTLISVVMWCMMWQLVAIQAIHMLNIRSLFTRLPLI
jgi:hypothetical protein